MMADIEKETVDFQPTYDDSSTEPTVLPTSAEPARERLLGHRGRHGDQHPAAQPGRGGRRAVFLLENQDLTPTSARRRAGAHPGPDFPTAGFICGRAGIRTPTAPAAASRHARAGRDRDAQGRPGVDRHHRDPYQVNKATLIEDRRARRTRSASKASPTSATKAIAAACASSSISARASRPRSS
jgi:DNA gyrase subunit A